MPTVNQRIGVPQAMAINGVDAGGMMSARIQAGYDNILSSEPDGLAVPVSDREIQFVRGTVVTQDWIHAIDLLTGAVGTYIFYERKSGVAEATGYIKHTITAPVIHRINIDFAKGRYATISFDFECRAVDQTKTIADMWAMTDSQGAPTYITAARGCWRIFSTIFAQGGSPAICIYHVTAFNFSLTLPLVKECNDSDIAYTCVDARVSGMTAIGSITFQDSAIASAKLKAESLLLAARNALELNCHQSGGATDRQIVIAGVVFDSIGGNVDVTKPFSDYSMPFRVVNNSSVPLTLDGTNKIITTEESS